MPIMRPEEHRVVETTIEGWPARVTSWRLGARWICHVDNVSPGAIVARGNGDTREAAEAAATELAATRLRSTRRLQESINSLRASRDRLEKPSDV